MLQATATWAGAVLTLLVIIVIYARVVSEVDFNITATQLLFWEVVAFLIVTSGFMLVILHFT